MKKALLFVRSYLDRIWRGPDAARVEEELDLHMELLTREFQRQGLSAGEAREAACHRFGDLENWRTACDSAATPTDTRRTPMRHGRSFRAMAAAVPLAVLAVTTYMQQILWRFAFYPALYRRFAFYVPETLKNAIEIAVCLGALFLVLRIGPRGAERELALSARPWPAFLFGLVCSSPMLIGFALTRAGEQLAILPILYFTVISPFTEELVSRGYALRQLHARAGWPFWAAAAAVAAASGLGHIEKGQTASEVAGLFLLIASGSVVFSWLVHRWESLWVPFALHFSMNLWWQLFNVSRTAIGGWFPFCLQSATIVLAVMVTLRYRPAARAEGLSPSRMASRPSEGRDGAVERGALSPQAC